MQLSAGKYRGMRRMADRHGRFKMTAVDQLLLLFTDVDDAVTALSGC